jgi:hypothetical protein
MRIRTFIAVIVGTLAVLSSALLATSATAAQASAPAPLIVAQQAY